jgi:hypothetical protein
LTWLYYYMFCALACIQDIFEWQLGGNRIIARQLAGWEAESSHLIGACLQRKVLEDSLAINKLLCHEPSGGEHGKTAVLEFLGANRGELNGVGRLEAKGIEANVTRGVVGTEKTRLVNRGITRSNPSVLSTVELDLGNAQNKDDPERSRDLREVGDGGSLNGGIEEERRSLNLFANKESDNGQHGNASMGELSLAVTLEGVVISLRGEAKGIEESHRGEGSRKILGVRL